VSRLDRAGLIAALGAKLPAGPDPDGVVDLVAAQGRIMVAASSGDIRPAIERLRPLEGYRWLAINGGDLFVANPSTLGTKVGILDENGRVLKAADLPRKK
jgi:hypothetical protein